MNYEACTRKRSCNSTISSNFSGRLRWAGWLVDLAIETLAQIDQLRNALNRLIVRTLELTTEFPITDQHRLACPRYLQPLFARIHDFAMRQPTSRTFAFLTFNYDLIADVALQTAGLGYTYALEGESGASRGIPLLKLHGSLHWGTCDKCNRIADVNFDQIDLFHSDSNTVKLGIGSGLENFQHEGCGGRLQGPSIIVPPSWDKHRHHKAIDGVWRRAAEELRRAEDVILVGYSLPETDSFFRFLFGLGTDGPAHIRRILVINPDRDDEVRKRFESFIGQGIRHRVEYWSHTNIVHGGDISIAGGHLPGYLGVPE